MKIIIPTMPLSVLMLLVSGCSHAGESLKLTSPAFENKGTLPIQFTCEGEGISPPLNWTGIPDGTQSLVVIMDHMPIHRPANKQKLKVRSDKDELVSTIPEMKNDRGHPAPPSSKGEKAEHLHWYWGMYNIPAQTSGVIAGQSIGTLGSNGVNHKNEYTPPCSKGPGPKTYGFHIYALSTSLDLSQADDISEAILRKNMSGSVLDSDSLTVNFARSCQSPEKPRPKKNNDQQQERSTPPSTLPLCTNVMSKLTLAL